MTNEITRRAGRPSIFDNAAVQLAALVAIRDKTEDQPSRFLKIKLEEAGLVSIVEEVKTGQRGRPAHVYGITDAARAFIKETRRVMANEAKRAERAAARAAKEAAAV